MKYFSEVKKEKLSLKSYFEEIEGEYKSISKKDKSSITFEERMTKDLYYKLKLIYTTLGDVEISKDMIEVFLSMFACTSRYGSIKFKPDTIKTVYDISEKFPELTSLALKEIYEEYIKDLFDEFSLVEVLEYYILKYGKEDKTFEMYMELVLKYADEVEKKYKYEAENLFYGHGEYTFDFVVHFKKFIVQHHITLKRFCDCVPSAEIFFEDQKLLLSLSRKSKDCYVTSLPVTFEMLEDYLDGDEELSYFKEESTYHISTTGERILAPISKSKFLKAIKEKKEAKQKRL